MSSRVERSPPRAAQWPCNRRDLNHGTVFGQHGDHLGRLGSPATEELEEDDDDWETDDEEDGDEEEEEESLEEEDSDTGAVKVTKAK